MKKEINIALAIESILQERAKLGTIPLPDSDEVESEYDLPQPPHSIHSGRRSIQ
jgi:hypothetical protein